MKKLKLPIVQLCKKCPCLNGFDQSKIQIQWTLIPCEKVCEQLACKFSKKLLHEILSGNPSSIHSGIHNQQLQGGK